MSQPADFINGAQPSEVTIDSFQELDDDVLMDQSLDKAAYSSVRQMRLYVPAEATVTSNIGNDVQFNRGLRDGVRNGQRYSILRDHFNPARRIIERIKVAEVTISNVDSFSIELAHFQRRRRRHSHWRQSAPHLRDRHSVHRTRGAEVFKKAEPQISQQQLRYNVVIRDVVNSVEVGSKWKRPSPQALAIAPHWKDFLMANIGSSTRLLHCGARSLAPTIGVLAAAVALLLTVQQSSQAKSRRATKSDMDEMPFSQSMVQPMRERRVLLALPVRASENWKATPEFTAALLRQSDITVRRALAATNRYSLLEVRRFNPVLMRAVQDGVATSDDLNTLARSADNSQRQCLSFKADIQSRAFAGFCSTRADFVVRFGKHGDDR